MFFIFSFSFSFSFSLVLLLLVLLLLLLLLFSFSFSFSFPATMGFSVDSIANCCFFGAAFLVGFFFARIRWVMALLRDGSISDS